jgi:hypothetical protein
MKISKVFGSSPSKSSAGRYHWVAAADGLHFLASDPATDPKSRIRRTLQSNEVGPLLAQIVSEDMAGTDGNAVLMSWEQVHELVRSRAYGSSLPILELPPRLSLAPKLQSSGSLADPHFAIGIAGWVDKAGKPVTVEMLAGSIVQADGRLGMLSVAVWRLLDAIASFAARSSVDRQPSGTRRGWGAIRRLAIEAEAVLDDFLVRSVVVTPEKLDIEFRRAVTAGITVVEIAPGFDGAPERWLEHFDKALSVPEHLNIPTAAGAVHIALSEPVRKVLREVKRLPGRRVAGPRAEALLLNPISALGDVAAGVIDPEQLSAARERAGIRFERFRPFILNDALGYPRQIGIDVDSSDGNAVRRLFASDEKAREFTAGLEHRIKQGLQLLAWQEFEFELDGDAPKHLAQLTAALAVRAKPPVAVQHDRVFDLTTYYDRVVGIGEAQPFISAYLVKRTDDEGWFPTNLLAVLKFRPPTSTDEVAVPVTPESLPDLGAAIASAKAEGRSDVRLPGFLEPLPLDEVEAAIAAFEKALRSPGPRPAEPSPEAAEPQKSRPTLLIKGNIDAVDHQERRERRLEERKAEMHRPLSLKQGVVLRDHQIAGVARLQLLFSESPDHCRGVLLADDMGLGKTLQLLTFIASAFERDRDLAPALIVAPVSLLENWVEEIGRFFAPGAFRIMAAYGDALANLRVPRESIDAQLQREGLIRFLKHDWRGDDQVVLTTYETLRDLEFSFAQETWSILVCDEAQKIKNPNAMVTRAAKKLKVHFRVACTGTPVENSLSDLWCLFDLIQPGLLGALNEFGRDYGRPIETGAPNASDQLEKLRGLIAPQVIRRTKADVAKDLPRKTVVDSQVEMSNEQRGLYVGVLDLFNRPPDETEQSLHHLGVLQYLRLICADPRPYGIETFVPEEARLYRRKAPKMDWLIRTLHGVRVKGEKALIFAEHRDVQRLLQHYIQAEFGLLPKIVNGDTSISVTAQRSRHKLIAEFQLGPGFGVMILSPLAVGFGVNIQAANHVIHYLRHWNPAKEDQSTDRAYRIGQTKDVFVYCPLSVAKDFKTFDVKLDELLTRKRALAVDMLQGAGAVSPTDFDLSEILPEAPRTVRNDPVSLDLLEGSDPTFFEALAAVLWQKQGYVCHLTPQSDAGVDVVGIRGNVGVLIQCKTSSNADRSLGWEAVRDVAGGAAVYAEQFPTVRFVRIGITNQRFNARAHERARAVDVRLVEQTELRELIEKYPTRQLEVLSKLSERRFG